MTTKLRQKQIKGGDPSFDTLQDELRAMNMNPGGGGYMPPADGIPQSHLSSHLQKLLTDVGNSLLIQAIGVRFDDLDYDLEQRILKIDEKYLKPAKGIPMGDLEQSIQDRLTQFANYYVLPQGGIPRVDLDGNVQYLLSLAEGAYKKPSGGIPWYDLDYALQNKIDMAAIGYVKPPDGIPDSDLAERYVTQQGFEVVKQHMDDDDIHITDHDKLLNVGNYTHKIIDEMLDSDRLDINALIREVSHARADFSSVGNRLDSLLGLNSVHEVKTEADWNRGTLKDLQVNSEGFVGLTYQPGTALMELYDIEKDDFFKPENLLGNLYFQSNSRVFLGDKPWISMSNRRSNVGVRLSVNVYADVTGIYEFATQFSGRMRLQVGSKLLYDTQSVFGQVDAYTRTGQVELEAGRLYNLVFEGWYLYEGDRVFGLTWKKPGTNSHTEIDPTFFNNDGYMTRTGEYVSEFIDVKDNNISRWTFEIDASENRAEDDIIVEIQRSTDGVTYDAWKLIDDNGDIGLTPTRYCRVRIRVNQFHSFYSPIIRGFKIQYISSMNNEIMNEIILARDGFTHMHDRLISIEQQVLALAEFDKLNDQNSVHPEYFASVRLAEQELNMLKLLILESERQADRMLFSNAAADTFKTANFIDDEKSARYEIVNESVRTLESNLRLEGNNEWSNWDLDKMDFVEGDLRLSQTISGGISNTVPFDNTTAWSTRDSARLAENYQSYIAQPFYTSKNMNMLTRLQVRTYDTSYQPKATLMVCTTIDGENAPDIHRPIWSEFIEYKSGTINITNLRIPIRPEEKYWIVIKRGVTQTPTGYSRWYLVSGSSSNVRLRTDNPEKKALPVQYTPQSQTDKEMGWLEDAGYYLNFHIDEASAFESSGSATRVLDLLDKTEIGNIDITSDISVDGMISVAYQDSEDGQLWNPEQTSIDNTLVKRFVKIIVKMQKSSQGFGSPTIQRFDIFSRLKESGIVTQSIELESIPTHVMYYAEHDEGISFNVSRDDGRTWKSLDKDIYTALDDISPGTKVRLKVLFDGRYPNSWLHNLAFSATTYKDISQQNVTALYEEYISEHSQQVFKLRDPYVLGNHSLQVYLNGIRQSVIKDYMEIDRFTILFNEPLIGGLDADRITFIVAAGAYDQHDAHMKAEIDYVKERVNHLNVSHTKEHTYSLDGKLMETRFNPEYYIQKLSYEYDANGRKVKATKVTKTYVEVIEYNYNEHGFLTGETTTVKEVTP